MTDPAKPELSDEAVEGVSIFLEQSGYVDAARFLRNNRKLPGGQDRPWFAALTAALPHLTTPPDTEGREMTGAELIAAERQRQIDVEGWTPEHDAEHVEGEMAWAARQYVHASIVCEQAPRNEAIVRCTIERLRPGTDPEQDEDFCRMVENPSRHFFGWYDTPRDWPWDLEWWKPSADPIPNLVKAGALIAAEIDRLTQ